MADFMSAQQIERGGEDEIRADLEKRNTVFLQLMAREDPKTAITLGPQFLELIGVSPRGENDEEAQPEPEPEPNLDDLVDEQTARMEDELAALERRLFSPTVRRPSSAIILEVARKYGLEPRHLVGPSHRKAFIAARYEAMARIRDELGYSYPQIGQIFGGRNHTTVMYAVNTHHGRTDKKSRYSRQESA
jgi:hypothetical protein